MKVSVTHPNMSRDHLLTSAVYDDDTTQIPRSTTVIVRRQPAQRSGAGRAARYVTGQMPVHAKNPHRVESANKSILNVSSASGGDDKSYTEEELLMIRMNEGNSQVTADLKMSQGKPVMRSTYQKSMAVPDKPLPPTYVCHRCGEKGHWIQACPTNNDPNYDGKHKFKRTTGIPRSMLEVVEKPDGVGEDGKIDPSKIDKGLMYTTNGEWVKAKVDQAAWQKFQDQHNATAEKAKEAAVGDQELRDRGLECPIDNRAFVDPVKTPCCGKTYCRDCIETAVLDADLTCPNCGKQLLLDNLESDDETAKKLSEFENDRKVEKGRKEKEASKSPKNALSPPNHATPTAETAKSPAVRSPESKINGNDAADTPDSSSSKFRKRSADEELENNRQPPNPAASPKQETSTPNTAQSPKPQPPKAPKNMTEFVNQMSAMAGPSNMNGFGNPMMNGIPMNMGMGMGMPMMGMNPMGMPDMNMMNRMNGMNGMNGMGFPYMNAGMGWQGQQQQQPQMPWMNGMQNGMAYGNGPNNGGNDGAYFRQPVNPQRHQGKQRRQRSVDYKQM